MSYKQFMRLVADEFSRLPERVQVKIKNVALLVEDEPSEEIRKREGLCEGDTLLGYYQGIPLSERGEMYGVGITMPDTITLYIKPILAAAEEDRKSVQDVIAETIWHEYAHHFGMDEEEVRAREKDRDAMV